jgi:hypothetical protein
MSVTYRVLGSWADVCALPDGRFVGVHSEMGKVVAQIIGGPVLWETVIPTDIARYQRCAASDAGEVRSIGVGADDNAYVTTAAGSTPLGTVGGQNCVAIGWNGRAFVTFRTLYDPATREIKTYARMVDGSDDVILPIPIGHTSQGFREAIPGASPMEDRIIWSDNLRFQFVAGRVLHKPSERNGVIVGQINGTDAIQGWNGAQFFHAIDGQAYEPHIAFNGSAYAIAARTGRGAAFVVVPPYPAIDAPPPPPVEPPPPVVVPPKEPPVSVPVPDRSGEAAAFLSSRLQRLGSEDATREHSFAAVNALCHEFRKTDIGWGTLYKSGGDRVRERAADVLLYRINSTEAQVVDVVGDAEGHDGSPRPGWSVKDIRRADEWRPPYPISGDDDDPGDVDPPKPPDVPPPAGDATLGAILAEIQAVRAELRRIFR